MNVPILSDELSLHICLTMAEVLQERVLDGNVLTPKKVVNIPIESDPTCLVCGEHMKNDGKTASYSHIIPAARSKSKKQKHLATRLQAVLNVDSQNFHCNILCSKCERHLVRVETGIREHQDLLDKYKVVDKCT